MLGAGAEGRETVTWGARPIYLSELKSIKELGCKDSMEM